MHDEYTRVYVISKQIWVIYWTNISTIVGMRQI
jgi:hypothetical protein